MYVSNGRGSLHECVALSVLSFNWAMSSCCELSVGTRCEVGDASGLTEHLQSQDSRSRSRDPSGSPLSFFAFIR